MKYLRLKTTNPYYNLAVEEYLFSQSSDDIFMLWQNEPTVVIGRNQNAYAEVNLPFAEEHNIHICRRITGGGTVYHDLGNINYTFISSEQNAEALNYARFAEPILLALEELGLNCALSGRNDLEYEGRKFSGNAQHMANGRILHHGTLLFDTDLSVMSSVLKVDKEKLMHRAIKSCSSRVVNLSTVLNKKMSAEDFIEHIETFVRTKMQAEPLFLPELQEVGALQKRNESAAWIYSQKQYLTNYTVSRKKKYPFGILHIEMLLKGEFIEKVAICGDFFGDAPTEELEKRLEGLNPNQLPAIDISKYIRGMTFEEFSDLVKQ